MKKVLIISAVVASAVFASGVNFIEANPNPPRAEPTIPSGAILSYNSSIKDAKESVVNISTTKNITNSNIDGLNNLFNDPFFKQFFGFNFKQQKNKPQKSTSLGSGVIISPNGYIVTNNHVIDGADQIVVNVLGSNTEYKAKLVGADPKTDLAVIKIEAKGLKPIAFANSANALEGDVVFAIGNPFGVGESVTRGIISALNKDNIGLNQYENFIQTDASINPGNSGGALVDSRGALVGINSAIISRSGGNNGIGFAIPSNMVQNIAKQLIMHGKINRGYVGIMLSNLNKDQKDVYKHKEGALITSVQNDSPAQKAGLNRGDLIIKVNNTDIKDARSLVNLIGSMQPNTKINVEFERNGNVKNVDITLANNNMTTAKLTKNNEFISGLSLSNLTDEIRYKYKLPQGSGGVLVIGVKPDSTADKIGFRQGDVIIQIADKGIKNLADFESEMKKQKGKKSIIWIKRGDSYQGLVIK